MRARVIRGPQGKTERLRPNPERARVLLRREAEANGAADALLASATEQAERLVHDARHEASTLVSEARSQSDGERALRLLQLEQQAAARLDRELEGLRTNVGRLAVAVAEKILGHQLDLTPESVASIVEQVLRGVCPARRALIRVHPQDAPYLQAELDRLRRAAEASEISVEQDASIARGGCIVDTPQVQADARLSVQLAELAGAVEAQLRQCPVPGEGSTADRSRGEPSS